MSNHDGLPTLRDVPLTLAAAPRTIDLITYLVDEKVAEVERRYAEAERRHAEELEQKLAAMLRTLQDAVEDTVILRFPNTPAVLVRKLRSVSDLQQLASLRRKVLEAPDQAAVEALLAAIPPVA